jgi:RNA polymerase sigma-70 factor (ECF subfamily)
MIDTSERRATFSRLMEEHGVALRRLAGAYLSDPATREDLFQEIVLAVWTGLPGFRGEASERTWLYRIAHNTASAQLHKLQRRREHERQPKEADPNRPSSIRRSRTFTMPISARGSLPRCVNSQPLISRL